jgi:hypothetical protein
MNEQNVSEEKKYQGYKALALILLATTIIFALLYILKQDQQPISNDSKDNGVRVLKAPKDVEMLKIDDTGRIKTTIKNGDTFSFQPPLNWEFVGNENQPSFKIRECLLVAQPDVNLNGGSELTYLYLKYTQVGDLAVTIRRNELTENPVRNYVLGSVDVFNLVLEYPSDDSLCLEDYFVTLLSTKLESRKVDVLNIVQ